MFRGTDIEVLIFLLLVGTAPFPAAQTSAIAHNTWTNGTPMPIGVSNPAVGVLHGQICVVAGVTGDGTIVDDTQIYNPSMDTWSTGVPLPTTLTGGVGAVVDNILYVMGGSVDGVTYSKAVWALNPWRSFACAGGIGSKLYVAGWLLWSASVSQRPKRVV